MNAEETIRELHTVESEHKNDKVLTFGIRIADMARDCANTIEELQAEVASLTAQLAASQKREKAAIEDIYFINGNDDGVCSICQSKDECTLCLDGTCSFAWRGPREEEKS